MQRLQHCCRSERHAFTKGRDLEGFEVQGRSLFQRSHAGLAKGVGMSWLGKPVISWMLIMCAWMQGSRLIAQSTTPGMANPPSEPGPVASPTPGGPPFDWSTPTVPNLGAPASAPPTRVQVTPREPTPAMTSAPNASGTNGAGLQSILPPGRNRLTSMWKVSVSLQETTSADDNINISHSNKESDITFSLTPEIALGWGETPGEEVLHSSLYYDRYDEGVPYAQTRQRSQNAGNGDFAYIDYSPTFTHYLTHSSDDEADESATLVGGWGVNKLQFGTTASLQTSSGGSVDVGGRTKRTVLAADLTASYAYSDKTSFSFDFGGSDQDYASAFSSSDLHASLSANHALSYKTNVGVSFETGLRQEQASSNQYYDQAELTGGYQPNKRLNLSGAVGAEVDTGQRQSTGRVNPIFSLNASYILGDRDTLALDASESTTSSAEATNQTVNTTGVDLEWSHSIATNFAFDCGVGFHHAQYISGGGGDLSRTDDYFSVGPSLTYTFLRVDSISLSYEHHENLSTQDSFSFVENIESLSIRIVF